MSKKCKIYNCGKETIDEKHNTCEDCAIDLAESEDIKEDLAD